MNTEIDFTRLEFRKLAQTAADTVGSSWAFVGAVLVVVLWAITGPLFQYSDSWQLAINTLTSIVTFIVVFLIQNAQNRDARAIHLKLDELIHGVSGARNALINLQDLSDEQLAQLQKEFERIKHGSPVLAAGAAAPRHERDSIRAPLAKGLHINFRSPAVFAVRPATCSATAPTFHDRPVRP